jgi:hypothetical protein
LIGWAWCVVVFFSSSSSSSSSSSVAQKKSSQVKTANGLQPFSYDTILFISEIKKPDE